MQPSLYKRLLDGIIKSSLLLRIKFKMFKTRGMSSNHEDWEKTRNKRFVVHFVQLYLLRAVVGSEYNFGSN